MKRQIFLLMLGLMLGNMAFAQNGGENRPRPNRLIITAGIFKPEVSTELNLDMNDSLTASINAEDDLGMSRNTDAYRIDVMFRLTPRLAFTGGWYKIDRNGSLAIREEINYQDSVYAVGANVNTRLYTSLISGSFRYSILSKKKIEAGLSAGLRWVDLKAKAVAESDGVTVEHQYSGSAPAPLPGLFVSTHILPSLMINYNLEYFKLGIQGVDGKVVEHRIAMAFYPLRNLGAGMQWSDTQYSAKNIPFKEDLTGDIDHRLRGFTFFVSARF